MRTIVALYNYSKTKLEGNQMMLNTIEEVHNCCFDTLLAFDNFCKVNDIDYMLAFGTLLGAVRSKDFIPWDDDLDIFMTRDQFEKLLGISPKKFPPELKLELPCENNVFFDFVPHIVNTKYLAKRLNVDPNSNCSIVPFCMDILVLDNAEDTLKHRVRVVRQKMLYSFARGHRTFEKAIDLKDDAAHSSLQLLAKILGYFGKHMNLQKIYLKYTTLCKQFSDDSECYYSSNSTLPWLSKTYAKQLFGSKTFVTIRSKQFPAPANYDAFLRYCFGNYMELPEKSKRHPEHYELIYVSEDN